MSQLKLYSEIVGGFYPIYAPMKKARLNREQTKPLSLWEAMYNTENGELSWRRVKCHTKAEK